MADITLAQLTSGTVSGTGVFDSLMKATKAHLQQEYDAGRITGKDYANVYLGSMQTVMAQAVQFVLQEQTADKQAELLTAQQLLTTEQILNAQKSNAKMDAEIALLGQKKKTEEAQILDTVDAAAVAGVIGKQKGLYQAQTDGFARDAEQKLVKVMIDTWNVRQTTDGALTTFNGLSDANIKQVVDAARAGIGLAAST